MITPSVVNHEEYTPTLPLLREVFISVGAMHGEARWLNQFRQHIPSEPCFRETENVTISDVSLEGNPCSNFVYLVVKRLDIDPYYTRSGEHVYRA